MRLLRAELLKLNRPLLWGVAAAMAVFCVLLVWGAANNANLAVQDSMNRDTYSCAQFEQLTGQQLNAAQCRQAQDAQRQRAADDLAAARLSATNTSRRLDPVAAGAEAAGLTASLPGALLLALLAGGHLGGEWSGRTLKNLLSQHGRRHEVLAAKLVSLWLALVALMAACWAALAAASPLIRHADNLPDPHEPFTAALRMAGSHLARALLVLAVFAIIGLLAGVATRNTVGTISAVAATMVGLLALGTISHLGQWTPASWVEGWMGFTSANTSLPDNFWSRFTLSNGSIPSHMFGLAGLLALFAVAVAATLRIFHRTDVTG